MKQFDKKKILKQIDAGEKSAMVTLNDCLKEANKTMRKLNLTGYESSALAVERYAEVLFKIKMQTRQTKAQVEVMEAQLKAQGKCKGCTRHGQNQKVEDERGKTPVS